MVKRSEIVNVGGLWLEGLGLSVGSETLGLSVRSETLGLFPRVRRAAPSLRTQSETLLVDSYGLAKSAL